MRRWLISGLNGSLLLAQYVLQRGYIHFDWLKQSLLWLQKWF